MKRIPLEDVTNMTLLTPQNKQVDKKPKFDQRPKASPATPTNPSVFRLKRSLAINFQSSPGPQSPMSIDDSVHVNPFLFIEDIDFSDHLDPQFCTEYINEIYDNLRDNEQNNRTSDYMQFQTEINTQMRGVLIDWLVEVAEEYKLTSQTLYLTVNFIDRYLSKQQVVKRKLQLIGICSLLLAAKYDEIYPPTVYQLIYISDNTYQKEELFQTEQHILQTLEFKLTIATPKEFLRRTLKAAKADPQLTMLATFLCELTIIEYKYVLYLPSVIAAASVCLALHTLGRPAWNSVLEHYTKIQSSRAEFRACVGDLFVSFRSANTSSLQAVVEKYLQSRFFRVANPRVVPLPATLPF